MRFTSCSPARFANACVVKTGKCNLNIGMSASMDTRNMCATITPLLSLEEDNGRKAQIVVNRISLFRVNLSCTGMFCLVSLIMDPGVD